jgi:peptidoglycan hydrolase-like protein with peptidoglycan-binding domain
VAQSDLYLYRLGHRRSQASGDNRTRIPTWPADAPGINQLGTPELSKNDMRVVEEALQAKGYRPGKIDGVADDDARAAIRAFQKDHSLSMTGMVDQKTADQLGVKISSKSGSAQRDRSTGGTSGQSGSRSDPKEIWRRSESSAGRNA